MTIQTAQPGAAPYGTNQTSYEEQQQAQTGAYNPQGQMPSSVGYPDQNAHYLQQAYGIQPQQGYAAGGYGGKGGYGVQQQAAAPNQWRGAENGWESKQEWPGQTLAHGGGWNQGNDWTQPDQGHVKMGGYQTGGMKGGYQEATSMPWNINPRHNKWNEAWDQNDKDDDEVRIVRGKNGGQTVECCKTFEEVRKYFPAGLVDILTDGKVAAFDKPTAIQAYTWPSLMQGEDIIGVAKTGSGKTLAFLLPGFIRVKQVGHDPRLLGPKILVLAPTRELCQQIYEESEKFGEPAEIFSACAYGGADKIPQLRKFRQGPHVCIGCPGRLLDYLQNGQVRVSHADYFVLDEADRMLDMGFEPQIRNILQYMPNERQSCLFTATWPKEVASIASQICFKDSIHVQVGTSDTLTSNSDITQHIIIVDTEDEKWPHMQQILTQVRDATKGLGGTLIFTSTKRGCGLLARQINQYMRIATSALHGDMEQRQRDVALRRFKEGHDQVLVATDVAQRGLDVKNVAAVINYDTPNCAEDYVHRIGRTGRAGEHGDAYTFLFRSEANRAKDIYKVMQKSGQTVPPELASLARTNGIGKSRNSFGSEKGFGKGGKSSFGGGKKGGGFGNSFGRDSGFGGSSSGKSGGYGMKGSW